MPNPIILLDMDGVIADWHSAVFELYGRDLNTFLNDSSLKRPLRYAIHEWLGVTYQEMWEKVNRTTEDTDFWFRIKPFAHMNPLYKKLSQMATIFICTTPGLHPLAYSQKLRWLNEHLDISPNRVIMTHNKEMLAKPHTVLVDDCDQNIEDFLQHGGRVVKFPQMWNKQHPITTSKIDYVVLSVKQQIEEME